MSRSSAGTRSSAGSRSSASHVLATGGRSGGPPTITNNVLYDGVHALNVYEPVWPALFTVVHVHGGGWTSNTTSGLGQTKDTRAEVNIDLSLAARGFLVFSIDYRLIASQTGNLDTSYRGDMITNVLDAVTWARGHADDYNGPVDHIALVGESAGSQLALMATIMGTIGDSRPDATIGWSVFARLDQYGNAAIIKNYLGISADPSGAGAATAQAYSPYNQWVSGIATPVRMCTFTDDISIVREADQDDLAGVITAAGGSVTTATITGSGHADFTNTIEIGRAAAWLKALL